MEESDLINVQKYMDICRNTQSADHYRKKTGVTSNQPDPPAVSRNGGLKARSSKSAKYMYEPLVGDPCYRYNKCAKERFFKNRYLAFLFIQYAYYYGNEFVINKQWRVPPYQTLSDKHHQDHEGKITCLKAIFREFVILSLKTLKRCSIQYPGLWRKVQGQIRGLELFFTYDHF